jgi:membrane-bound lytic murein transglycosylase D
MQLIPDGNYGEAITQLLEHARQHYLAALEAESINDSACSVLEFESAITILNELAYYPNIENNRDFNDLSQSVIDDYEKYIASIDSLGAETSVFALREKLNQLAEAAESPDEDAPRRIISMPSIPLVINGHVEQNIRFFQERGRHHMERWLYRAGKYFPTMTKIFAEENAPEELIYLSMIESGLNPVARSWAKAVGLWQFIKGTGSLYGLKGNFWYDDRRDFELATRAAARHLSDLYQEFGDWYLALAAYNSGAGRVTRAMRRSGSRDFWKLRPFLPRETRNYVPQYIAAAVITLDPGGYGFEVEPAESLEYDVVTINDCVDLRVLAQCAGTDVETLQELNPQILQWCTPPAYKGFRLRIPRGSSDQFAANYAAVPDDQKRDWLAHTVRKGETLASIGKKYGVTATLLAETNQLRNTGRISVGKTLMIPVPSGSRQNVARVDDSPRKPASRSSKALADATAGKTKLIYRIRKGDTLGRIASWFEVRTSDLRLWNDLAFGKPIHIDDELAVWIVPNKASQFAKFENLSPEEHAALLAVVPEVQGESPTEPSIRSQWTSYRVKAGDNLGKIAAKYGVSHVDIKKWNGLRSNTIMTGQKLEILIDNSSSPSVAQRQYAANESKTYKVKAGDTLYGIASSFGVSVRKLRQWNNLRSNHILVGQEIIINS